MKKTLITGIILSILFFILARCANNYRAGTVAPPPPLPANVAKRVIVDTAKRRLIVQERRPSGDESRSTSVDQQNLFLPPHATIDLTTDGNFSIIAKPYGFYIDPYIGFGYSNVPRYIIGAHLLYYKYLDAGVFFSTGKDGDKLDDRIGVELSYNVWRSMDVGLGYDNKGHTSLFVSVKL